MSSDTNWKVSLFLSFRENNEETLKGVSNLGSLYCTKSRLEALHGSIPVLIA